MIPYWSLKPTRVVFMVYSASPRYLIPHLNCYVFRDSFLQTLVVTSGYSGLSMVSILTSNP